MPQPLVPLFYYKIRDPITGAVVIDGLPHIHKSKWNVRGFQAGQSGSSFAGPFSIALHPPGSQQSLQYKSLLDLLGYNQRVEGWISASGTTSGGDPNVTGIIRKLPSKFNDYTIEGSDTILLMEKQFTGRTESFLTPGQQYVLTSDLFKTSLTGYSKNWYDDFTGTTPLTNYTNNGVYSIATDEGYTVAQKAGVNAGDGVLLTASTWANALYKDCFVEGLFHIVMDSTGGAATAAGMVAASDGTFQNLILGDMVARTLAGGRYEVDLRIWQKVAGAYTKKISQQVVVVANETNFRFQLTMIGKQDFPSTGQYTWRLLINGVDVNCFWTYTATPSGQIGIRISTAAANTISMTNLGFFNRTAQFAQGTITTGTKQIQQTFHDTPMTELANNAAMVEGFEWRKNPKSGLNADTMDFYDITNAAANDLSSTIKFERGYNLVDVQIDPNLEAFASSIIVETSGGRDNAGWARFINSAALTKYGFLQEVAHSPTSADFRTLREFGRLVSQLKANPGVAKRATVLLDAATAFKYRELNWVTIHWPERGLLNLKTQIIEYTITEGEAEAELVLDQYSVAADSNDMRKLMRVMQQMIAGADATLQSSASQGGGVFDNRYGSPVIDSTTSKVAAALTVTHTFFVPENMLAIQKVTVMFTQTVGGITAVTVDGNALGGWVAGAANNGPLDATQLLNAVGPGTSHTVTVTGGNAQDMTVQVSIFGLAKVAT